MHICITRPQWVDTSKDHIGSFNFQVGTLIQNLPYITFKHWHIRIMQGHHFTPTIPTLLPPGSCFQLWWALHFDDRIRWLLNKLKQYGCHFADCIFKCIYLNENIWISKTISLKFLPEGPINIIAAMVQMMAWHQPGAKPLSEPMMASFPTHICITRPQWVDTSKDHARSFNFQVGTLIQNLPYITFKHWHIRIMQGHHFTPTISTLLPPGSCFQLWWALHFDDRIRWLLNKLRQYGCHFADCIFKCIYLNENIWISKTISLKFLPEGPINIIAALVQMMAWHQPGAKPLSEPMMARFPTHICITQSQWVDTSKDHVGSLNFQVGTLIQNLPYITFKHWHIRIMQGHHFTPAIPTLLPPSSCFQLWWALHFDDRIRWLLNIYIYITWYWGRDNMAAISQNLNEGIWILIEISLKFVPKGPMNPALVQIMAWCRPGAKPLSEPMMASFSKHICITQSQWVDTSKDHVGSLNFQVGILIRNLPYITFKHWHIRIMQGHHFTPAISTLLPPGSCFPIWRALHFDDRIRWLHNAGDMKE